MNQLKTFMYMCQRGYRGTQRVKTLRILSDKDDSKTEKKLYPDIKESDIEFDEDYTESNFNEPDFTHVHRSYDEHMRETYIEKQKLKGRIVAQKLFKSNDPNFITWAEREQIINLYKKNSDEWSPEQLSQSFPALPETIKKLIKSKWFPKSVETVIKYDEKVIENWNQFKSGHLNLEPRLAVHLEKFKNRKIEAANFKEIAEKFLKPPRVFPTPKSKIFTSIIQSHIEKSTAKNGNDQPPQITDGKDKIKKKIVDKTLFLSTDKVKNKEKYKTYDEFLEKNVDKITRKENLDLEDQLLVNEYKEQKNNALVLNHLSTDVPTINEKNSVEMINIPVEPQVTTIPVPKFDIDISSLETGILEWKKKELSTEDNYPRFIKIPHAKAKSGVTFKVKDRYYDCDGEFLYRVPGLKS